MSTTGAPICWGLDGVPDRGMERVTGRIARTHWRLRAGERVLRTRVQPIRCGESAMPDEDPHTAVAARATARGLRIEVSRLVYNCARAPEIDARLRADGSIEIGIGYVRPVRGRVVSARCDCLHDLVVWIADAPAGTREVVLETERGPVTTRVVP